MTADVGTGRRKVAVVVPAYDARGTLPDCLRSLQEQTLQPTVVYVVDNGSQDGTWEWLQQQQARWDRLRAVRELRRGPAAARNAGIRRALAEAEFIAFLDADCSAQPDWLEKLVGAFAEPRVGAATGCVRGVGNETVVGRYTALVAWDPARPDAVVEGPQYGAIGLAGCSACVRTAVLKRVGLFDEDLRISEDWDLGLRVVEAGWRLRYVAGAEVRHRFCEQTVGQFVRRVAKYGPGRPAILRRHFRRRFVLQAAGRVWELHAPLTGSVQVTSPDKVVTLVALAGARWPWALGLLLPYGLYLGSRIRSRSLREGVAGSSVWQLAAMVGLDLLESYVAAASLLVHSLAQGVFCV